MDLKPSRGFSIYPCLPSMSLCARLLVPGWVFSRLSAQPHKPSTSGYLLSVDTQATCPWSIPELQAKQVSEVVAFLRKLRHREERSHLLCGSMCSASVCPFRSCRSRFWGSGTLHLILLNTMYGGLVVGGGSSGKEMRGASVTASLVSADPCCVTRTQEGSSHTGSLLRKQVRMLRCAAGTNRSVARLHCHRMQEERRDKVECGNTCRL